MSRKVALIGSATSTSADAPYGDDEWEIWGMVYDASLERLSVGWEIHRDWQTAGEYPNCAPGRDTPEARVDYINFLDVPVYFLEAQPDIPNALIYPLEDVARDTGVPLNADGTGGYFESTIGYQLALLVRMVKNGEDIDMVGLWGIDLMTGSEYAYQRPNAEYFIGMLRGLGVKVYIPKRSALLSSEFTEPPYRYE